MRVTFRESPSVQSAVSDTDAVEITQIKSERTTLTLEHTEVLRGTTSATLLAGFGNTLRSTSGGIGIAIKEADIAADNQYGKSFPVKELDMFFSHSWHAKWHYKYLTLLFYFNATPAFCGALCVGVVSSLLRYETLEVQCPRCTRESDDSLVGCPILLSCGLGSLTFVIILLVWHHLIAKLPNSYGNSTIFLDKVCIHQTDLAKKAQGIRGIGSILSSSRRMLVVWDHTYFARLWCVYELSAFKQANRHAEIIVIPVTQGAVAAALLIGEIAAEICLVIIAKFDNQVTLFYMTTAYVMCLFPFFVSCTYILQQYLRDIRDLQEQLCQFSVRKADCFCCSNGHINPDTGAHLPCDRLVVNHSITYWYGHDREVGLDIFDNMVRTDFQEYIRSTLGGAHLPYRLTVLMGLISGLSELDWSSVGYHPGWRVTLRFWQYTLLLHPVNIGILVKLMNLCSCSFSSCVLQRGVEIGFALVACANIRLLAFTTTWCNSQDLGARICWSLVLVFAVWLLYFKPAANSVSKEACARKIRFPGGSSQGSGSQVELADLQGDWH